MCRRADLCRVAVASAIWWRRVAARRGRRRTDADIARLVPSHDKSSPQPVGNIVELQIQAASSPRSLRDGVVQTFPNETANLAHRDAVGWGSPFPSTPSRPDRPHLTPCALSGLGWTGAATPSHTAPDWLPQPGSPRLISPRRPSASMTVPASTRPRTMPWFRPPRRPAPGVHWRTLSRASHWIPG